MEECVYDFVCLRFRWIEARKEREELSRRGEVYLYISMGQCGKLKGAQNNSVKELRGESFPAKIQ
jgi:hypothetical protein